MAQSEDKRGDGPIAQLKSPWHANANSIWLASSLRLQRNIEKFKFPHKLDLERKKQIINLVGKDYLSLPSLKNAKFLKVEDLPVLEREYLVEHFLLIESLHQMAAGAAFVIDESGELLTMFNTMDHLTFIKVSTQHDFESGWAQLINDEIALGKNFNYAFSSRFGFLTADPSHCGSAFHAAAYLQLPALIHTDKVNHFLEIELEDNLQVTGIQGNPTEVIGDVLVVQNNYTLGVTEENICSGVRLFALRLLAEEKAARQAMRKTPNPAVMDRVSRAFAVLAYSYQIEAVEALNAFSLLKLGLDLGWVEGCTNAELNALFFKCRRAHLLYQHKDKIPQDEIPHRRAEFIHESLKSIKLLI